MIGKAFRRGGIKMTQLPSITARVNSARSFAMMTDFEMAGRQVLSSDFASTRSGSANYLQRKMADEEKKQQGLMANTHLRFIPRKKLQFNYLSGDGPMSLVFEACPDLSAKLNKKATLWRYMASIAAPMAYAAVTYFPPEFAFSSGALFLPALYHLWYSNVWRQEAMDTIQKLWLLKNGDQLVAQTVDGAFHKLNIVLNTEYEIQTTKTATELVFVMTNCSRDFKFSNVNAKYLDYDLVDRLIRSVPVDTERYQMLFHHLLYKKVPVNLRANEYYLNRPQLPRGVASNMLNSPRVLSRIQNRMIYRPYSLPEDEWPAEDAYKLRMWTRNETPLQKEFWADEQLIDLQKKYMKYLPTEDRFYKMVKMTRKDFFDTLEACETEEEKHQLLLDRVYSTQKTKDKFEGGRRGVLNLDASINVSRKKWQEKERMNKFYEKYAKQLGMTAKELRQQGGVGKLDEYM